MTAYCKCMQYNCEYECQANHQGRVDVSAFTSQGLYPLFTQTILNCQLVLFSAWFIPTFVAALSFQASRRARYGHGHRAGSTGAYRWFSLTSRGPKSGNLRLTANFGSSRAHLKQFVWFPNTSKEIKQSPVLYNMDYCNTYIRYIYISIYIYQDPQRHKNSCTTPKFI